MHGVLRTLQDFEVLYVGIFAIDVELDSTHRDIHVYAVENLTQSSAVEDSSVAAIIRALDRCREESRSALTRCHIVRLW